jgi:hypothetical protein
MNPRDKTMEFVAVVLGLLLAWRSKSNNFHYLLHDDSPSSLAWAKSDRVNSLMARGANIVFTDDMLRQIPKHQLLEYLVMFVSYCAYDLQCNVRSIPSIMSAVRKEMLLKSVNCDVFDSNLLKAVKQGASRLPAPAHRVRLPSTFDMISHVIRRNTLPQSTMYQYMLAFTFV